MQEEINQLKRQVEDLTRQVENFSNSTKITFDDEQALRTRLRIDEFTPFTTSAKSASSENQAVNEAGMATYDVMKKPDGFIQVTIGANTYYIPYFT